MKTDTRIIIALVVLLILITAVSLLIRHFQKNHFDNAPNTYCFTCCHVLEDNKPILYVSHDEDGCWQFLCGQAHTEEEARVVSLEEIVTLDKAMGKLAKLKCGEYAERDTNTSKWIIEKQITPPCDSPAS